MIRSATLVAFITGATLVAAAIPRLIAEAQVAPIDRQVARLSTGEPVTRAQLMAAVAAHGAALSAVKNGRLRTRYGRLLCAAATANPDRRLRAALQERCIAALQRGLSRSPAQPYAAFALASSGVARGLPAPTLDRALRLSIASGPALDSLVGARLALGLRLWPSLSVAGRGALAGQIAWAAENRPATLRRVASTPLRRALVERYAPDFGP